MARRRRHVDHFSRRRVRRDDRVRLQHDRVREDGPAACFVTDLGTVVALGLIFAPFTVKTLIFLGVGAVVFVALPWVTPRFFRLYGGRPSELETKFLLLCLFGMGALAAWADSEAVLPAYLIGMVLAGTVGRITRLSGDCEH